MKCPKCGNITDPAKDLCSRCFSDLRAQKRALGLAVINNTASYEELLARRVKILEHKEPLKKIRNKKSFLGIFRSKRAVVLDASPSVQETIKNDSPADSTDKISQQAEVKLETINIDPQEAPALEAQKLKLGKRQKEQMLGLLRRRKDARDSSDLIEANAGKQKSNARIKIETRAPESEYSSLWTQSFDEIGKVATNLSEASSIQVSSLLTKDSQAALAVYFDLAYQELSSPLNKRQFIKGSGDRRVDSIESRELKEAVGLYQKDSARIANQEFEDVNYSRRVLLGSPATCAARFLSWTIDASCVFVISSICGVLLYLYYSDLLSELLLGANVFSITHFLSAAIWTVPVFYLFSLLLLPLLRYSIGFTFGEYLTKLRLFPSNAAKLTFVQSFIWNQLSILTVLSIGLLEIRKNELLWREKVLDARLLRT